MMQPSADLRAKILAAAAQSPSPTRTSARRTTSLLMLASFVIAVAVFESMGGFAHSERRPLGITMALAGGWALASSALTYLALSRGGSTLARAPFILVSASFIAPLAMFVWITSFYGSYVEPAHKIGYRCLGMTLGMAALPLATFLVMRRGIEPRRPAALGAIAGAMCGAWAGVLVDLWCPLTNRTHALVGHVLPLVLLISAGASIGSRLLAGRRV